MDKWFKNLSIFQIIASMFFGFLLLAGTNYIVIRSYVDGLTTDAMEIDAAGRTRMLSQKILLLVERLDKNPAAREDLINALDDHDNILSTFKTGGIFNFNNTFINPTTGENRFVLNQSIQVWDSIYSAINAILNEPTSMDTTVVETILVNSGDTLLTKTELKNVITPNPKVSRSKLFLERNGNNLLASNNKYVQSLVKRNKERLKDLYTLLFAFLIFNFTCIFLVLFATKKYIFSPLKNIADVSKKLSDGDIGIQLDYPYDNELGKITNGINHLSENLENSRVFIERIEKGDLNESKDDFNLHLLNENSIESALIKMRNQMQTRAHEDEVRKWAREGMAKFINILRASENVNELGDIILSNLVDYTNSNQAGLYLLNEQDDTNKYLELVSLYAFNRKKYDSKMYRLGEGLVGQTFLEKKTTYLIEVPQDYITIVSGLGDSNPKSLLLVPLKIEDTVHGILEIASLNEYEEHQIQFIENLCENIASTISSVKTNEKTKLLLEESQQLTEEMQAQEEEMRQNMEELTATQEEMVRKEKGIKGQLDAINESLGMAEYTFDGNIISTNSKFNEALGYDSNTINQLSFEQLHGSNALLDQVKSELRWSGWLNKKAFDGKQVELKSYFSTSLDEDGRVIKIIEIVTQFFKKQENDNVGHNLSELEEELTQNLNSLEVTQHQFIEKLTTYESIIEGLKSVANIVVYNEQGLIIEISENIKSDIGSFSNITDLFIETLDEVKNSTKEIELHLRSEDSNKIKASIKQLAQKGDEKKYIIIWVG